jgi:hypothetical protein
MAEAKTSPKRVAGALTPPPSKKAAQFDMKEAVQQAIAFTKDFYPQAKDIRLEEVEPISGGWAVVISFATGEPSTLASAFGQGASRIYKTITIDSGNGQAQSLKVWKA